MALGSTVGAGTRLMIALLLQAEVSTGGSVPQRTLEELQLAQEVEVWGNGRPALFHKPYKVTDRMWVRDACVSALTE